MNEPLQHEEEIDRETLREGSSAYESRPDEPISEGQASGGSLELSFLESDRAEVEPGGAPESAEQAIAVLTSLLFASPQPLTLPRLQGLLGGLTAECTRALLDQVADRAALIGLQLKEIAGGFQLATREEYAEWVWKLTRRRPRASLTPQALETLAIVAYKQPVTKGEVDMIRGMDSGAILRHLVDLEFLEISGRKEVPGRPLLYATTRYFLKTFGLARLEDLPAIQDLKKLYSERERQRLDAEAAAAREARQLEKQEALERMERYHPPVTEVARALTAAEREAHSSNSDEFGSEEDGEPDEVDELGELAEHEPEDDPDAEAEQEPFPTPRSELDDATGEEILENEEDDEDEELEDDLGDDFEEEEDEEEEEEDRG